VADLTRANNDINNLLHGRLAPPGDQGGGFGLFRVREGIGLIGGVLEIETSPANGSRFALVVPIRQECVVSRSAEHQLSKSGRGEDEKAAKPGELIEVLIVDDHALFRDGMDRTLRKQSDLKVVGHAGDGQEAIDLAGRLNPDVILMDISMPKVNGIEATRIIHRKQPKICIIGLSMYEDQYRAQAMRDAGACEYMTKGCAVPELLSAIRSCVSGN
jgi:CheY-like chemotaxis protein